MIVKISIYEKVNKFEKKVIQNISTFSPILRIFIAKTMKIFNLIPSCAQNGDTWDIRCINDTLLTHF